ncbi:MAG: gliding motility-associated C-terminal domain-containing protein, partial [Bacteroidetes bacterium]|nr:gliding motility-associated C-terminal domain-containing protein [Bacteroidota bacterium]
DPTVTKKFYPTMADLNAGTNEILNPNAYQSTAPKQVFVKVTTVLNCTNSGPINLEFYPTFNVNDTNIISCFIDSNPTQAVFNLTSVNSQITNIAPVTFSYFTTQIDAVNNTNPIQNASAFVSDTKTVFVRATDATGCYNIAKINLTVTPPAPSSVLVDKIICAEKTTTLDAGPGYTAYEWSNGATTQSIANVGVGNYWVKLTKNNCVTKQNVKVVASEVPVITSVEITNSTVTINANGGYPPYQYSIDSINWQASNIFSGLPRGQNTVYVKDSYNCVPVNLKITVPNLLNAITPNNDGVNDEIDYSALAYKDNLSFTVFDRYGKKVAVADKTNGYKWDGKFQGKKLNTGTYWYIITWNENDPNKTLTSYTGWVLLKN